MRLRDSLGKSRRALVGQLAAATFDPDDDEAWERLEEALIFGDVGVPTTAELVRRLEARDDLAEGLEGALAEEIEALMGEPGTLDIAERPSILLFVGVNGTGKTTTIGKLAQRLREHDHDVIPRRADTFRAAADEQLEVWAERAGSRLRRRRPRGEIPLRWRSTPIEAAPVAGPRRRPLVDTAGRLHTNQI